MDSHSDGIRLKVVRVALVVGVTVLLGRGGATIAIASPAQPALGEECVARLDGSQFPFLVPEHVVWGELFEAAAGKRLSHSPPASGTTEHRGLSAAAHSAVETIATTVLMKTRGLRARRPTSGGNAEVAADLDAALAELVLDGRDQLIRALAKADFDTLRRSAIDRRSQTTVTFRKPGHVTRTGKCQLSVSGRTEPHLIPEAWAWEFYFRARSAGALDYATGPETYAPEYLAVLERHHLQGARHEDIALLLAIARDTIERVDARRAQLEAESQAGHQALEAEVGEIVLDARASLLRLLPSSSWLVVSRHEAHVRGGASFDYPPSL
ncbi:MAG: hypothetical protein KJ066_04205 [Acidobacteria bacterium]|nr:hypothetical protein [Acidobacteriota bacterium]